MMRNLVTSLLEHGEIRTTVTKAKEMRKYFDKMIGLGKRNDLHARRQALSYIKSKDIVHKLFEEYGPLYKDRNGGYTRIFKLGRRLGDNAQMALIQMVGLKEDEPIVASDTKDDAISEVKSELQAEDTVVEETMETTAPAEEVEEAQAEEVSEATETEETSEEAEVAEQEAEEVTEEETKEEKDEEK